MLKNKRLRKSKYTKTIAFITLSLTFIISIGFSTLRETLNISGGAKFDAPPTLKATTSDDTDAFRNPTYKSYISTITFENEINIPDDVIDSWDIGTKKTGEIIAYIVNNETDSSQYDLYIQSNGTIPANENMSYWFSNFYSLETIYNIDLLNTENTTNTQAMFKNCFKLKTISRLENLNTKNVTDMSYMFADNEELENIDLSNWDTSNVTNTRSMFEYCYNLKNISGLNNLKMGKVTDVSHMFYWNESLENIDLSNWDTSNVINTNNMFYNNNLLQTLDLSNWDTTQVEDMNSMFVFCYKLTSIKGIENFNTSNVRDMSDMFSDNQSLTTLDLRKWNTSNVTNISHMFDGCENLTSILGIENFDTKNVTSMSYTFSNTPITSLNLSNWDTSNVTDMSGLFYEMKNLQSIEGLNNFNTSNVTDMGSMFRDTGSNNANFTLDISNFDTSKVTSMYYMFYRTGYSNPNFNLILGEKFDTSNVTEMSYMFFSTGYSSTVLDITITIKNPNVRRYDYMFSGGLTNKSGAKVTVNYTTETSELVDKMIATKNTGANVVKGYNISNIISFTIDGVTYNAYEGMTWEQWIESSYDTVGFNNSDVYEEEYITTKESYSNGARGFLHGPGENNPYVLYKDVIQQGVAYDIQYDFGSN